MRIRKIKDKDTDAAAQLLKRSGVKITGDEFIRRLHHFQYKRNHTVVVVQQRGKVVSLMHIGIEPSLTSDRIARVYALFIDPDNAGSGMRNGMLRYGEDWAQKHGCQMIYNSTPHSGLTGTEY